MWFVTSGAATSSTSRPRARETTRHSRPRRAAFERALEPARAALGKEAAAAALAEGSSWPLEEAIAYALAEDEPAGETPAPHRDPPTDTTNASQSLRAGPLSPREAEVAQLVAEGLSNPQIAARLLISERTAARHVEHILNKLGFSSRAQIAAWVVQQGLVR